MGFLYNEERCHAVLGSVIETDRRGRWVDRKVSPQIAAALGQVRSGRVVGDLFGSPQEAGLRPDEVRIPVRHGTAPAWLFRPSPTSVSDTWAVHIHGAMSGRESVLRSVDTMSRLGYTSLVPSYRGDPDNTLDPFTSTLGQTEWHDVDAAMGYARTLGARRFILVGWSLGASIALKIASDSRHRSDIQGQILIAPILDWESCITHSVKQAHLPAVVGRIAVDLLSGPTTSRWIGLPEPIDFHALSWIRRRSLPTTTLVISSLRDLVAPYRDAQLLESLFPDRITLAPFRHSSHAVEWNADPALFMEDVASWCGKLSR
ncbi:alpha/beta hydrolase [Plantibacter sp. CFBP 8804]|uniref:alpha/beta hydrolase n=1 Tax=Plantibacter sp. CFBP 8804 TaxID=2775270 RepID=UPI00177B6A50|nr:alpha/beta fold hydrolase [Plantibacter sp. CFBP 8804]MBD8518863.1 alpha/beta fold hydrolase [Plantibacter sp. CFBP 8804]